MELSAFLPPPGTDVVASIRRGLLGRDAIIDGPFGPRPLVYADYTASGRAVGLVEDAIRDHVLPMYANTHTESSATGRWMTALREDARATIGRCVNATSDHAVIFTGSGASGAISHLIGALGLRDRPGQEAADPPVVVVGPYEHHSNEVQWRESIAEVIRAGEDARGGIDLGSLDRILGAHTGRRLIGSFSAASNVTGVLTDVPAVAGILREHGALTFFDYAAAAPYTPIDVSDLDAVFVSPHKFVGGPGSPGILVARRSLFTQSVPRLPGGGTVAYVNESEHVFLEDVEVREEGGTPDIVGSIRAGMAFALKHAVGEAAIAEMERRFLERARERWAQAPNLELLGPAGLPRLPIMSFVVRHGAGYLHHNLVVALLNDLFGIQSRGGCSCAGPYGHSLLGIDLERSRQFRDAILSGCEGVKPGWARLNFHFVMSEEEVEYLIDAVLFVAEHGHRFLASYDFDAATGLWSHESAREAPRPTLAQVLWANDAAAGVRPPRAPLSYYLELAQSLIPRAPGPQKQASPERFEQLHWFPTTADDAPIFPRTGHR